MLRSRRFVLLFSEAGKPARRFGAAGSAFALVRFGAAGLRVERFGVLDSRERHGVTPRSTLSIGSTLVAARRAGS